jgi:hypothetical protein
MIISEAGLMVLEQSRGKITPEKHALNRNQLYL